MEKYINITTNHREDIFTNNSKTVHMKIDGYNTIIIGFNENKLNFA